MSKISNRRLARSIAKAQMQKQGYRNINRNFADEWRSIINNYLKQCK